MGKAVILLALLVAFVAVVHESQSFRFRFPRFRFRFPRIRLPRIRLPRIRLPRIRLPRIRIRLPRIRLPRLPWFRKPNCPSPPSGDALFKSIFCTTDGGVANAGCINMCSAIGDMMSVNQYQQLCPQACQAICSTNMGKREFEEEEQDDMQIEQRGEDEFSAYDQDADGKISGEELMNVLKVHSREMVDDEALGNFLKENDVDGDGFLNKEEFVKINERQDDEDAEEFLREMEEDNTDDDEEPSNEEKREFLEKLTNDKEFASRLEELDAEEKKRK